MEKPRPPASGILTNRGGASVGKTSRRILILALLGLSALGARYKLYLQGGGDMLVREHVVEGERVRYYSVERGAWEEIPSKLVDLERTASEKARQDQTRSARREEDRILRAAERKARTELHRVPLDDGVYHLDAEKIVPMQQASLVVNTSKGRTLLRILMPMSAMPSKTFLDLEGLAAAYRIAENRPTFYLRLENITRLEILRLQPKKKVRRVQVVQTLPQQMDRIEEHETLEIFRQQLAPHVYKLWPVDPLPPGEYAIIEYAPGEDSLRVWDFALRPRDAQ